MSHNHNHHHHCNHHNHSHAHAHNHHHQNESKLSWSILLNVLLVCVEFWVGHVSGGQSLIADAIHNLSDVVILILSLLSFSFIKIVPNRQFSYGKKKISIILPIISGAIISLMAIFNIYHNFTTPTQPLTQVNLILIVALLGAFINGSSALLFFKSYKNNLNLEVAFWHLLGDALISFLVFITYLIVNFTHINALDSYLAIAISLVIGYNGIKIMIKGIYLISDAVPLDIKLENVYSIIKDMPGVISLHDLHIWAISSEEKILTVHVVIGDINRATNLLHELNTLIKNQFNINHMTIQIETLDKEGGGEFVCPQGHPNHFCQQMK